MTRTTARFRFEYHLFAWAENLSISLCGMPRGFFVGLREDGSVRRVYLGPEGFTLDGERKQTLADTYTSWMMYQPYGERGSGYIEWLEVSERNARQWLGRELEDRDFLDVRGKGQLDGWPTSWRVIVA